MLALRDAEDWARLELRDELLATRIREVHETLTEDVLEGVTYKRSRAWRVRAWDRYCTMRRRTPHLGNPTASAARLRRRLVR